MARLVAIIGAWAILASGLGTPPGQADGLDEHGPTGRVYALTHSIVEERTTLSSVDVATGTVVASRDIRFLRRAFTFELAANDDHLFVLGGRNNTKLRVYEPDTLRKLRRVALPSRNARVAAALPGGDIALADSVEDVIHIVDGTGHRVTGTISLHRPQSKGTVRSLSPDPLGRLLYLGVTGPHRVAALDLDTGTTLRVVKAKGAPIASAFDTRTGRLVATNFTQDRIRFFDMETGHRVGKVRVGPLPYALAIDDVRSLLYVANLDAPDRGGDDVSIVDLVTDSVVGGFVLPGRHGGIDLLTVTADGSRVYAADGPTGGSGAGAQIFVYDATAGMLLDPIPLDVPSGSIRALITGPAPR